MIIQQSMKLITKKVNVGYFQTTYEKCMAKFS